MALQNIATWGDNSYGELGNGSSDPQAYTPVSILAYGNSSYTAIAAGYNHVLAIDTTGHICGWGDNDIGQLGNNANAFVQNSPVSTLNTNSFYKISAGADFSFGLQSPGATTTGTGLWSWGVGTGGCLGNGDTTTDRSTPVTVPLINGASYTSVSAGGNIAVAINTDGSLIAWGSRVGDGSANTKANPTSIMMGMTKAVAGYWHVLALDGYGHIWAWGTNGYGQLGDNTTTDVYTPEQITFSNSFIDIAAGQNFSLALDYNGNVWAWGDNNNFQLGDGTSDPKSTPIQVASASSISFIEITGGSQHALYLDSNGNAWGAGDNSYGNIGNGYNPTVYTPIIAASSLKFIHVAAGLNYSAGILDNNITPVSITVTPTTCTATYNLQTITLNAKAITAATPSTSAYSSYAVTIKANSTPTINTITASYTLQVVTTQAKAIASPTVNTSTYSIYAVTVIAKSSLITTVNTSTYTLQSVTIKANSTPTINTITASYTLQAVTTQAKSIVSPTTATAAYTTQTPTEAAIKTISATTITGSYAIQAPSISAKSVILPVTITAVYSAKTISIVDTNDVFPVQITATYFVQSPTFNIKALVIPTAANATYVVQIATEKVIMAPNTIVTWGYNNEGELGANSITPRSSPDHIATYSNNSFSYIAAGYNHTLAIDMNGNMAAWGQNTYSQLGDMTALDRSSPVSVISTLFYVEAAAGTDFSLGLDGYGSIWAWGHNNIGQLGDNTNINRSSPVNVPAYNYKNYVFVSARGGHSVSINTNGDIICWGENDQGQIGDGTQNNRSTPTSVMGMAQKSFFAAAAGTKHTLVIDGYGQIWGWGYNYYGEIGNVRNQESPFPYKASAAGVTFRAVAAGNGHSVALDKNGNVWSWGRNDYGQLGNGTLTNTNSPAIMLSATSISYTYIACGDYDSLMIDSDGNAWSTGRNDRGQLGLGNAAPTTVSTPTIVIGGLKYLQVTGGQLHSVGLLSTTTETVRPAACTARFNPYGGVVPSKQIEIIPTHAIAQYSAFTPSIINVNDMKITIVGVPRNGSSPLIVDFTATVTFGGDANGKYKVTKYYWYFDADNSPTVFSTTIINTIAHTYTGYRGQQFSVMVKVDIALS